MDLRIIRNSIISAMLCIFVASAFAQNPKREFRGAWLHTVFQDQYLNRTTAENKKYLCNQLDSLKAAGINVVIFQVRPQADAFYNSTIEPWSRFLTNNASAPTPYWDPLEFIIAEAHARGMELHAWLNPYRVTSSAKQTLPKKHIYHKYPERFVKYDGKLYFDPGIPENRQHIERVVADIVKRYDIDGIHFDDYFYPYPAKGLKFPDDKSYAKYGKGKNRNQWRRENVDKLIKNVSEKIKNIKPWVRFGISPFGIWRNKTSDSRGSDTGGLQNYDDLYADVLSWAQKGWVDYLIPQIYWNMEHPKASYSVLVDWWNKNAGARHIYIGQSIDVTMRPTGTSSDGHVTQLASKVRQTRNAKNILGNCWWPGYSIPLNKEGIADSLRTNLQATIAIPPSYPWISSEMPDAVSGLNIDGNQLSWDKPIINGIASDCIRFVVYRFDEDSTFNLDNTEAIIAVTPDTTINISCPGYYVVTALDRVNNESLPSEAVIKQ